VDDPIIQHALRRGAVFALDVLACPRCGRRLRVSYHGRNATPAYYCSAGALVNGRGTACLRVGGQQLDAAVATTFLAACTPAGLQAALAAAERTFPVLDPVPVEDHSPLARPPLLPLVPRPARRPAHPDAAGIAGSALGLAGGLAALLAGRR